MPQAYQWVELFPTLLKSKPPQDIPTFSTSSPTLVAPSNRSQPQSPIPPTTRDPVPQTFSQPSSSTMTIFQLGSIPEIEMVHLKGLPLLALAEEMNIACVRVSPYTYQYRPCPIFNMHLFHNFYFGNRNSTPTFHAYLSLSVTSESSWRRNRLNWSRKLESQRALTSNPIYILRNFSSSKLSWGILREIWELLKMRWKWMRTSSRRQKKWWQWRKIRMPISLPS